MKRDRRIWIWILWMLLGLGLICLGLLDLVGDFWSGMGGGFLAVGFLQFIRRVWYCKSETYREKVDIAEGDERNRYLMEKAWSWAGRLYVLLAAIVIIALSIWGQRAEVRMVGYSVCALIVFYWGSYYYLKRKF